MMDDKSVEKTARNRKVRAVNASVGSDSSSTFSQTVQRWFRPAAVIAGCALAVLIGFWLINKVLLYFVARTYVEQITDAFQLNRHLSDAILWVSFAAVLVCVSYAVSFSRKKRVAGLFGILLLLVGHSLLLGYASRNIIFDRGTGHAAKCYVMSRDAIQYGERPGTDPQTGRPCLPVTPEMAERIEHYNRGVRPERILAGHGPFFAPSTGNPIAWYYKNGGGDIELFNLMGFHPVTGDELTPVTREVIEHWRTQVARRVPQRIGNPDEYGPFDPITGAPRVWYRRAEDESYEFY